MAMRNKVMVIGGVLVVAAVAVMWQHQRAVKTVPTAPVAVTAPVATAVTASSPGPGLAPPSGTTAAWIAPVIRYEDYRSIYGRLPKSLEDTQIPFSLQVDEKGQLTVTDSLRALFDYFMTTEGEEPLALIGDRLRELLKDKLPSPARERALAVLEQYLAVKKQEIAMSMQWSADFKATGREPELTERARLLREMRAAQLDAETYQAFYGLEDKREDYAIKQQEILRDKNLTPEQQTAALEAAEDLLPPDERAAKRAERETLLLDERITRARAAGASDGEIFRMREAVYGAEVAQRYAKADEQQSKWDTRISAYREQRAAILKSAALSDADKNAQIENLRGQLFDPLEQKRIPVIDSMLDTQRK